MSLPLYDQLYRQLAEAIANRTYAPGDRVPSEKELAEQFGVSRITSKKALELLEQDGLIERMRGKGSFVSADGVAAAQSALAATREADGNAVTAHGALHSATHAHARNGNHGANLQSVVGLVLPDFSETYALRLVQTIEAACAQHNRFLVVKRTYDSQAVETRAIQALVQLGVSGLIVFPVHGEYYNPELLRLVISGFPVVLVDRHLKGISAAAVYTDNTRASRELADYLIERGHREIAFVSPPAENTSTIEERIAGYRAALRENGGLPEYVLTTLVSTLPTQHPAQEGTQPAEPFQADADRLREFMQAHPQVTAFFACEYNLALLTYQAAQSVGRAQAIEIVCFDSPATLLTPPLFTHIRQDEVAMGREAVRLLLGQMGREEGDGRAPQGNVMLDYALIEGTLSPERVQV